MYLSGLNQAGGNDFQEGRIFLIKNTQLISCGCIFATNRFHYFKNKNYES